MITTGVTGAGGGVPTVGAGAKRAIGAGSISSNGSNRSAGTTRIAGAGGSVPTVGASAGGAVGAGSVDS